MSRHVPGSRMFQLFRSRRPRIARRSRATLRPILGGEPLEPRYALSVSPSVSLTLDKPAMFENANGRLTFTFTRSEVTDKPLWIGYEVSGSAQWGGDYVVPTNYPGRIQIHGYAASSILSIDPWPDSTVEPDETVSIRILGSTDPDNSYAIGTQAAVTGTILNDDFVVDLVLDGLPEETAPRPNEMSPGAILPVGEQRTRLDLNVIAPPGSGNVRLDVLASGGSSMITLWDAPTSGTQVTTTTWAYGNQPASLWAQAMSPSAKLADITFTLSLADIPSGATAKPDVAKATAVALDLDVDSNNDGVIHPANGPAGSDDPIEALPPGRIIFVNSDDDNRNGVADVFDIGPVAGENDLAEVMLAAAPSLGSLIVTYDDTIVRLYNRSDRTGALASGSSVAAGSKLYAEGRTVGTSLVTVVMTVNAVQVTDTVRLTVRPYPGTIDVDIDSDNNNDIAHPERSEWEETLEIHPYGIGKLIMLDEPRRGVTPIVLQLPTGLPVNIASVRVRIDWNGAGPAGSVRLWNVGWAADMRNPSAVSDGGNRILPGALLKLSDLRYNADDGIAFVYAEGVEENAALKTLAGVEAAPRLDERIRGTLVVNGDDAAFDEVKYLVANEDSFYYALHTRQEVRNALASRGVYEFADMPKFCLQRKSPLDLRGLGVPDDANLLLGEGSGVGGFKAMLYQDYITGEDQYVLAFGGTDDDGFLSGIIGGGDWWNNFVQGFGRGAPEQYVAAMLISDGLSKSDGLPAGHMIATGHSLGGGLASAAAMVGGTQADTFNAAWLREETLREPDGMGGFRERYPGSLARFAGAAETIDAYYIDWDILTFAQRRASNVMSIHPVGTLLERDGPYDENLADLDLYYMKELHYMPSVLYGLLVTESSLGGFTIDMLGYVAYFGN